MPKVGKMKFPYTRRGIEDAQNYANHSGKSLEMELPKYQYGGRVARPMAPGIRPPLVGNQVQTVLDQDLGGGVVMPDSIGNRRLGRGMRPTLPTYRNGGMVPRRPGMGRKMSPNQINMLRNKLAKFKKGIV